MMDKKISYWKIFFVGIALIIVFFGLALQTLRTSLGIISNFIEEETKEVEQTFEDVWERIECNIDYKDIHFKGFCSDDLLEGFQKLIEFDKSLELLDLCMQQPYAYKYQLCEQITE